MRSKQESNLQEAAPRRRRDWVKNAVIIFLAALLILTFFSNTIMNYSLPEVAAQYPQSAAIVSKIRGSGTVEAAQTYEVMVGETRTVASVAVKPGDKVEAGDTLLVLDQAESQELTEARARLEALQLEYDKMALEKGDQGHASAAALQQLQDAVTKAEGDLAAAQKYESSLRWYQDQVTAAQSYVSACSQQKSQADSYVASLTSQLSAVEGSNAAYLSARERVENYPDDLEARAEMQRIYEEEIAPRIAELNAQILEAQQNADYAAMALFGAQANLEYAQSALSQFQGSNSAMSVDAAQAALDSARTALDSAVAAAQDSQAQSDYDAAIARMDLEAKAREVTEAQELVDRLEAQTSAAKIVSRYSGVVQTVNVSAGTKATPDMPLMVVELTERGYTLTCTVTREQARSLREGMIAEITNVWNSGITMTLGAIQTDKSNPSEGRVLTFTLQGENVTVGQQLSFSIGDRNATYDVVIPSSAVHTDANGSFVYTVAVKSSPLGNRYTVRRTDVEVLASDDTHSAVSGEISNADFVITTSAAPLSPGDQVRIAE